MTNEQLTQLKAASVLLGKGVLVDHIKAPFFLRLLLKRHLKITLYEPTLNELIQMSALIVQMDISEEELEDISLAQSYSLINGNALRAIQVLLIGARLKVPLWSQKRLAHYVLTRISASRFDKLWNWYVQYSGVQDFTNTIRSILPVNNLSPMSQRSQPTAEQSEGIASGE